MLACRNQLCRAALSNVIVPPASEIPMNAELREAVEDRSEFEACYLRANEVGILHRDDDGEYTSMFTKVAWALWQERAQALRDQGAEIARLRDDLADADERAVLRSRERTEAVLRAEKAEALL